MLFSFTIGSPYLSTIGLLLFSSKMFLLLKYSSRTGSLWMSHFDFLGWELVRLINWELCALLIWIFFILKLKLGAISLFSSCCTKGVLISSSWKYIFESLLIISLFKLFIGNNFAISSFEEKYCIFSEDCPFTLSSDLHDSSIFEDFLIGLSSSVSSHIDLGQAKFEKLLGFWFRLQICLFTFLWF